MEVQIIKDNKEFEMIDKIISGSLEKDKSRQPISENARNLIEKYRK